MPIIKIFIILVISSIYTRGICQSNAKWEDSLAISFLQKHEIQSKIGTIRDTVNGKLVIARNYYTYKSFSLKTSPVSIMYVINFGSFTTETDIYMAIVHESNGKRKVFIL